MRRRGARVSPSTRSNAAVEGVDGDGVLLNADYRSARAVVEAPEQHLSFRASTATMLSDVGAIRLIGECGREVAAKTE